VKPLKFNIHKQPLVTLQLLCGIVFERIVIMGDERLNKKQTIILLLVLGAVLVLVRWWFMLFPLSFLFDGVLYCLAGYVLGDHLYYGNWRWGLLLALPAMLSIIYFFISATMATATSNVGLSNVLSFIMIPVSSCAGILLKNNRIIQHH